MCSGKRLDGDCCETFICRGKTHFETAGWADAWTDVFYLEDLGEVGATNGGIFEGIRARYDDARFVPVG